MADSKKLTEQEIKQYKDFYKTKIADYLADPKNIENIPPQLFDKYEIVGLENDTVEKKLWLVRRYSDGAMGFFRYVSDSNSYEFNRARREVELLAELNHLAIPKVMDYWDCEKGACLVRQYFEGTPLHVELSHRHKDGRGYFLASEAFELALCIGEILSYLEAQNPSVVHRDIKPQNIILMPDGSYKLVDFDVARRYDPTKLHDTTLGKSEGFAAPEQYGYQQSDPSADRYGLGVTLLYMMTGTHDIISGLAQVKDEGLKYFIQKCCEFAPAERFASVDAMMSSIRYLQEGFVPVGKENAYVLGTTLESYQGERKKLWLIGITHIAPNAFDGIIMNESNSTEITYNIIEEIILASNISVDAIASLKKMKRLSRIIIDGEHPDLIAYDGVLYERYKVDKNNIKNIKIFPPKKAGRWIMPACLGPASYIDFSLVSNFLSQIVIEQDNYENYFSIDGIVYENATKGESFKGEGYRVVYCPRRKTGNVILPEEVNNILPTAFHGCTRLTDIKLPMNLKKICIKNKKFLCQLFDGCDSLPEEFQHDWVDCDMIFPSDDLSLAKCSKCGKTRSIEHQYPPYFAEGKLSFHQAMAQPTHESVGFPSQSRFWNFTGKTRIENVDYDLLQNHRPWYDDIDHLWWGPKHQVTLHQIMWASDEEIHPGVTKGTVGGWIQQGAYLGDIAWIDSDVNLLQGGMVYGRAKVLGGAYIRKGTRVFDYATVDGTSLIGNNVRIYGNAHVSNGVILGGVAKHNGYHYSDNPLLEVRIGGNAKITGYPTILATEAGSPRISGNAQISGHATIRGNVTINGNTKINGKQTLNFTRSEDTDHVGYRDSMGSYIELGFQNFGFPWLSGDIQVHDNACIGDHAKLEGRVTVCDNAQVGGKAILKAEGKRHLWKLDKKRKSIDTVIYDRRYSISNTDTEIQIEQNEIVISGDIKIMGDTVIEGSVALEGDKLIDHGKHVGPIKFTRRIFDKKKNKWIDEDFKVMTDNEKKLFNRNTKQYIEDEVYMTKLESDKNGRLYTYRKKYGNKQEAKRAFKHSREAGMYSLDYWLDNYESGFRNVPRKVMGGIVNVATANFTRMVFDEKNEMWVPYVLFNEIQDLLFFKLEFSAPVLEDGEYLEIIIREALEDHLSLAVNDTIAVKFGDAPFLSCVLSNSNQQNRKIKKGIVLERNVDYILTWNKVSFSIIFTDYVLKNLLSTGKTITVYYVAAVDRKGLASSYQANLMSNATLTINRTNITPM